MRAGGGGGGGGEGELGGQCVVWNAPGRPRCCQYIDILFWLKRASQGPLLHTNTNSPSRRFLLLRALTGRSTLEIVELHFIWAATAAHSASSRPRLLINEYIGALKSRVSPTTTLSIPPPLSLSHSLSLSPSSSCSSSTSSSSHCELREENNQTGRSRTQHLFVTDRTTALELFCRRAGRCCN